MLTSYSIVFNIANYGDTSRPGANPQPHARRYGTAADAAVAENSAPTPKWLRCGLNRAWAFTSYSE